MSDDDFQPAWESLGTLPHLITAPVFYRPIEGLPNIHMVPEMYRRLQEIIGNCASKGLFLPNCCVGCYVNGRANPNRWDFSFPVDDDTSFEELGLRLFQSFTDGVRHDMYKMYRVHLYLKVSKPLGEM